MAFIVNGGAMGMPLKKNSPYTPFFRAKYMKMVDSGLMKKLKIKHTTTNNCSPVKNDEGIPLSYQKLILLFIIICGGVVFALMVLIFEIMQNIIKPKNKIIMKVKELRFKEIATQTVDNRLHFEEVSKFND